MAASLSFFIGISISYFDIIFWPRGQWLIPGAALLTSLFLVFSFKETKQELNIEWKCWKSLGLAWWLKPNKSDNSDNLHRATRLALGAYTSLTLVFAIFKRVNNGDAQIYNIARIPSMLITGSPFLAEHSSSKQAFADLLHDIIYTLDLGVGNIQGLGLVCWLENVLILSLVSWISSYPVELRHGKTDGRALLRAETKKRICWSQIAYMALPMALFQSTSVKNDLPVVLFSMVSLSCLLIIFERLNKLPTLRSEKNEITSVLFVGILSMFLAIGAKSYAILCLPAFALTGLILLIKGPRELASRNTYTTHRQSLFQIQVKRLLISLAVIQSAFIYWTHKANVTDNWSVEREVEITSHLTPLQNGFLFDPGTLLNPVFILFEFIAQAPLPFEIDPGLMLTGSTYEGHSPYPFRLGGYFGEDIAWPGPVFFVIFIIALGLFTFSHLNINSLFQLSRAEYSFVYGCFTFIALSFLIHWQPWFSRFLGIGIAPCTPYIGETIRKLTSSLSPTTTNNRLVIGVFFAILIPSVLAIGKSSAALLYSEVINRNHYSIVSYSLTGKEIAERMNLSNAKSYNICIEGRRSPSLYPLMEIASQKAVKGSRLYFPSFKSCNEMIQSKGNKSTTTAGRVHAILID